MTGTSSQPRRDFHVEGHGTKFQLKTAGASIALEAAVTGNDALAETEGHVVGTGGASTPNGNIVQGGTTDALAETVSVTVV